MLKDISRTLDAIKDAMLGYPGFPATHAEMAGLIGVDPANFANIINGRRNVSEEKLFSLHRALRLDGLGVPSGEALWCALPEDVARQIRAARGGDLEDALADRLEPTAFFALCRDSGRALIVPGASPQPRWTHVRQQHVAAGETLRLHVRPPIGGFLKLLAVEVGRVFGLDEHFGLISRRFASDTEAVLSAPLIVDSASPEALFIGLMQGEKFGPELPSRLGQEHAITPEQLAEWLRARLAAGPELRVAALRLFLV